LGTSRVFDRFYNGKIDDIAIYNRSLSAEEVWMLYLDNCQLYTLDGEPMVCQGQQNMVYHATDRLNTTYDWSYSGTGVGINQNSNEVTLHFSDSATSGTLKVIISGIDIATRTLDMHVVVNPLPGQAGMISGDTIVCRNLNEYLFSIPIIENATGYLWTYGGTGATIMGSSNTIAVAFAENATSNSLIVSGTNSCGSGPLSKPLYIYADQCDLNIPNSFSPNNDAVNQEFFIRNLPANSKLTIFNRLGKVLWKSDNYQNEWDGRDNHGYQLDSDTYWYVLIVPGIKKEFSGFAGHLGDLQSVSVRHSREEVENGRFRTIPAMDMEKPGKPH